MKVYISGYRDHWLSPYTILEHICFWRVYDMEDPKIERWSGWLEPICLWAQKVLDKIHPPIRYVKIDRFDTWSMDHSLGMIIVPMLKQLQRTKHGAPYVDDSDVPEHLRSTAAPPLTAEEQDTGGVDAHHFARWDWVLDEMIWAFEQEIDDDAEHQFYHGETDFQWKKLDNGMSEMLEGPGHTMQVDQEGLRAWNDRKQNGFRLFGRYYTNLWD